MTAIGGSVTKTSTFTLTVNAPTTTSGNVYYVATNGNDANSCTTARTISTPKRTINSGLGCLVAGDTLLARAGTYAADVRFDRSGTSGKPLTLKNYPGENPVIQGRILLQSSDSETTPIGWITIEGFEIRNGHDGIKFYNAYDIVIRNNNIHDNPNQGILGVGAQRVTIDRNIIARNGQLTTTDNHQHGMYITGNNVTITNNLIHSNQAYGIQIAGYSQSGSSSLASSAYAGASNWLISNNVIALQRVRSGIVVWDTGVAPTGITIQNNIFYRNSDASGGDGTNGIVFYGGNNNTVRNNLFYGGATFSSPTGMTATNNIEGQDPKFVNPSSSDFHLQSSSPAINTGTNQSAPSTDFAGLSRPQGSAYDIGAYEYGGTVTSQAPTVTLSASPTSITSGTASTLSWSSANATSCNASATPALSVWSGNKSTSGFQSVSPTTNTTFTLICTGAGGSASQSTTVTVQTTTGNVYYVATNGNDANSCSAVRSASTPKKTIASGIGCLAGGDTLSIAAGTYNEWINGNNIPSGSSWGATTKIIGAGVASTKLLVPSGQTGIYFYSGTKTYIEFSDFEIDGNSHAANDGIKIETASTYLRFSRLHIHHIRNQGILASSIASYLEFLNIESHDAGTNGTCYKTGGYCHGMYIDSDNVLVDGCSLHNNNGLGVQWYPSTTNSIMRNCIAYSNYGMGFYLSGSSTGTKFYNNTAYGNNWEGFKCNTGGSTNECKNNIAYGNTGTNLACGTVTCSNNLTSDPKFVNGGANDFRLQSTSPAINAGATLTEVTTDKDGVTRPQGSAYDIGAYEYGGTVTTPAPTVTITATPTSVTSGSASTLSWSSANATSCTASGAWSGTKSTSGSQSTGNLTANSTFTLSCTGTGGTTSQSTTVNVASSVFDFTLSNGGNKSVTQGSSVTNSVTATLSSGTSQSTGFAVSGLPSGATTSFSPTACSPTCSITLTINTLSSTPTGNSTVTVTATAGSITKTSTFTLTVNAPADTTAPIISNISVSQITLSTAQISWTTNENADSRIEYGLSSTYTSLSPLNLAMLTSHSQVLTSLLPSTTYHYRVKSKDGAGLEAVSGDLTFTTASPPDTTPPFQITNLASSNITSNSVTLTWSAPGDNQNTSSYEIRYGNTPITSQNFSSQTLLQNPPLPKAPGLSESITIGPLLPSSTYHFAIRSKDNEGNASVLSNIISITTLPAPVIRDILPPSLSSIAHFSIATSSVHITWQTDETADSKVILGKSLTQLDMQTLSPSFNQSHDLLFPGLQRKTIYFYQVISKDLEENIATSSVFSFKTATGTPPKIMAVLARQGSVILSWQVPDDPFIREVRIYRRTDRYPVSSDNASLLATITDLTQTQYTDASVVNGTTYFYSIFAVDDENIFSDPAEISFTPQAPQTSQSSQSSRSSGGGASRSSASPSTVLIQTPAAQTVTNITLTGPFGPGVSGAQVTLLQQTLVRDGVYPEATITGYYGSATQSAVRHFQQKHGIEATGIAGPLTRAKLNELYSGVLTPTPVAEAQRQERIRQIKTLLAQLIEQLIVLLQAQLPRN